MNGRLSQEVWYVLRDKQPHGLPCGFIHQTIKGAKEDENEGPSQSVQNQESLLREFVQQHRLSVFDTYVDDG